MADKDTVAINKETLYGAVIVILAAVIVISVMTQGFGLTKPATVAPSGNQSVTNQLSDAALKLKVQDYINKNLLTSDYQAEVTSLTSFDSYNDVANVSITQNGTVLQTAQVYVTKDGATIFLGQAFNTNENLPPPPASTGSTDNTAATQVTKTDKPTAQVFIMSLCPTVSSSSRHTRQ